MVIGGATEVGAYMKFKLWILQLSGWIKSDEFQRGL